MANMLHTWVASDPSVNVYDISLGKHWDYYLVEV